MTVTLVMTDVAGSTRLWAEHPERMSAVMGRHHELVHAATSANGGWRPVDQGEGDAVFAAFESPTAAVQAVTTFQQQLAVEPWPAEIEISVRVGVHTGEVVSRDGNLFGSTVNRCARLRGLGAGGQVLLSAPTWELVRDRLPEGVTATDLGEHRMKVLSRPEHVHQLLRSCTRRSPLTAVAHPTSQASRPRQRRCVPEGRVRNDHAAPSRDARPSRGVGRCRTRTSTRTGTMWPATSSYRRRPSTTRRRAG